MTYSCTLSRICVDHNLAFVNNCVKLIFNLCVKDLTKMFDSEACVKCIDADTDTLHISLACMVYTLNAVDVVMEFTLDNRLKVCLHVFTCNLNHISDAVLASKLHLISFRSDHCDLVILYLACITSLNKLCTVHTGTVKLNLHVFTTDDLTLECRCKCNRNVNVCDLDLNVTGFQRSCVPLGNICLADQALRNSRNISLVCDYRESKCDSACAACYDHVVQRSKCIYKCRNTFHCVFHQSCCIARFYVTEDQSCTKSNRYNMDYRCNVFSKRDHTYICACFVVDLSKLINDIAYQCYKDTLRLIGFYKSCCLFCGSCLAKDYCNTRDIACYKRYTKLTDHCICKMSVAWLFIRSCSVDVFQNLDELCAESCCNT